MNGSPIVEVVINFLMTISSALVMTSTMLAMTFSEFGLVGAAVGDEHSGEDAECAHEKIGGDVLIQHP